MALGAVLRAECRQPNGSTARVGEVRNLANLAELLLDRYLWV